MWPIQRALKKGLPNFKSGALLLGDLALNVPQIANTRIHISANVKPRRFIGKAIQDEEPIICVQSLAQLIAKLLGADCAFKQPDRIANALGNALALQGLQKVHTVS